MVNLVEMAGSGAFRFGRGRESERATKREGGSFSSGQVKFARRARFIGKKWGRWFSSGEELGDSWEELW